MTIEEFQKVDLRVATILEAGAVEGSDKLVRLHIDAGDKDETGEKKTRKILAGVGKVYDPQALIGRQVIVICNLAPRFLMGHESNGMLLAASDENGQPVILCVDKPVLPGEKVK